MVETTGTPYQYTHQNPIRYTDPSGMSAEDGPIDPPTVNVGVGITLGSHNNGVNFSASISQGIGNWSVSAGVGATAYSTFANTRKGGVELRGSLQAGYDDGNTSVTLGTNVFRGLGGMSEFSQRTGILNLKVGDFRASYENDGMPFAVKGVNWAGDGSDRYRTAAVNVGIGDFSAGFNLFTGSRTNYRGDNDKVGHMVYGRFGERMPNGLVNEEGSRYRMGAAFIGYGSTKIGIDSDRYVRHPIQDMFAHNMPGTQQPGFQSLTNTIKPFVQTGGTIGRSAPRFTLYNY